MGAADEILMARALELAELGCGWVDPNPMVGCVIADASGVVIGEGWHRRYGGLHAEREALADCARRGNSAEGATVYVTLEPCCHWGKTPPCTSALIEAGVARVVVGCLDANPLVASAGCAELAAAGIDVEVGVLEERCRALNKVFFHYIKTGKPYVIAKYASTLDGRIATSTGESKWITGEAAREHVHASRARYAAVMVGIGTVLADDPLLNCRLEREEGQEGERCQPSQPHQLSSLPQPPSQSHQPVRIVCDCGLRTPIDSQLVKTAREIPLVIAIGDGIPDRRLEPYESAGCKLLRVPAADGRLDLAFLIEELGKIGIDSVYVEGGPALLGSFLDAKLIDYIQAYIAPKVFGGAGAPCAIAGKGALSPTDAAWIEHPEYEVFGSDILIEGEVRYV